MGESLVSSWRLPRHTSGLVRDGILALPIMWRGRVIGLIALHTLDQRITRAQKEGLLTTCHHLAAIFGMKHFAKGHVRAAESKVPERDITHAIALQQSLQPALPHVVCGLSIAAHSRPAYYVGGDYYDLITVGSGQLAIVIADVEGKGVSGALFGNLLRTTVHFLAKESPSPADVFNRISSVLYKEPHPPQMFFTMFYAVYDQEQRTLRYASSGHVPPVIIRSRRSDPERLPCDGALLTTGNAKPYQEHATALMPGDVLALYTDGLTEQRCRDRMPFGEERLLELLRSCAASDAETILTTVLEAHRRSLQAPPDDDLTLIIIKAVPDTA
jgi:serine phosphatase RsbU (regulator of sigma subunit)